MGIQSAVMAKQFGENFQYGKRRISAMSNEEFNKLTPKMIQDNANAELKAMIPSMEESVREMRVFQTFLIREFLKTLNDAIKAGFGELFGINQDTLSNIEHYLHGHGGGHDGTTPEPEPEPTPTTPSGDDPDKPSPPTEVPTTGFKYSVTYSYGDDNSKQYTATDKIIGKAKAVDHAVAIVLSLNKYYVDFGYKMNGAAYWRRINRVNAWTAKYPDIMKLAIDSGRITPGVPS